MIEKKYPKKLEKKQKSVEANLKHKADMLNKFECLPVVICESNVYPGMKTYLPVHSR